jgi:hypothetical protein
VFRQQSLIRNAGGSRVRGREGHEENRPVKEQRKGHGERQVEAPGGSAPFGFARICIQESVPPDCAETIEARADDVRAGIMDRSAPASPEGLHSLIVAA